MKKWIRWKGLIAFIIVGIAALLIWYLLADWMVKTAIEKTGTALAGARVELKKADLSLSPPGLTLFDLQVTDKEHPLTNAVEVSRIAFTLDGLNLLRRKVLIREMAMQGVRFGTPRSYSGAITKAPPGAPSASKNEEGGFTLPSVKVPDVKKILQEEQLASLQQIADARKELEDAKTAWKTRVAALPDQKAIDAYEKRINDLRRARPRKLKDYERLAGEASSLAKDIERDAKTVQAARKDFSATLAASRQQLTAAEKAPQDDIRRIMDKYGVSAGGVGNMSRLLFGNTVSTWVGRGMEWYGRVKPLLTRLRSRKNGVAVVKPARAKGMDVRFPEYHPLPDFLISAVNVSLQEPQGTFTGTIKDVTTEQAAINRPTTFAFSGEGLADMRSLRLDGMLDHVQPDKPDDRATITVEDYRLAGMQLSRSDRFPVSLARGTAHAAITASVAGDDLHVQVRARVSAARFTAAGQDAFTRLLANALAKVTAFTVNADVTGTLKHYDVSISSDLDRVLKDAAGKAVREQAAKAEKAIKDAVAQKTAAALKGVQGDFADLASVNRILSGREGRLDDLLKRAQESVSKPRIRL